jgi:hypothetical protein
VDKQGKRFGFVKFREVGDEKELLRRISNIWIDSFRIRINLSKFSRRSDVSQREGKQVPVVSADGKTRGGSFKDDRSFKSVLIEKEGRNKGGVGANTGVEAASLKGAMVSMATEVVWEVEVEEERMSKLEGAYVGFMTEDRDVHTIQNNFPWP